MLLIIINPLPSHHQNLRISTVCTEEPLVFNVGSDSLLPNNLCCCRQLDSIRCKLLPNEKGLESFFSFTLHYSQSLKGTRQKGINLLLLWLFLM